MPPWLRNPWIYTIAMLALAVTVTVQAVKYWVHLDSVRKTVMLQTMVYHQSGLEAYRTVVLEELAAHGMVVPPEDLDTVEDRARDELRVELRYEWPLNVLFLSLPRLIVERVSVPMLDA